MSSSKYIKEGHSLTRMLTQVLCTKGSSHTISTINSTNLAYLYFLPYYQDHNPLTFERLKQVYTS